MMYIPITPNIKNNFK